jgi:hypothetical protein
MPEIRTAIKTDRLPQQNSWNCWQAATTEQLSRQNGCNKQQHTGCHRKAVVNRPSATKDQFPQQTSCHHKPAAPADHLLQQKSCPYRLAANLSKRINWHDWSAVTIEQLVQEATAASRHQPRIRPAAPIHHNKRPAAMVEGLLLDGDDSCISVSDVLHWQGRLDHKIILLEVCIKAKQLFSYFMPVHLFLCHRVFAYHRQIKFLPLTTGCVPVTICTVNLMYTYSVHCFTNFIDCP